MNFEYKAGFLDKILFRLIVWRMNKVLNRALSQIWKEGCTVKLVTKVVGLDVSLTIREKDVVEPVVNGHVKIQESSTDIETESSELQIIFDSSDKQVGQVIDDIFKPIIEGAVKAGLSYINAEATVKMNEEKK